MHTQFSSGAATQALDLRIAFVASPAAAAAAYFEYTAPYVPYSFSSRQRKLQFAHRNALPVLYAQGSTTSCVIDKIDLYPASYLYMQNRNPSSYEFLSSRPVETKSSKNLFTINDTRYRHIKNLENRNKFLSSKLLDLEQDMRQIDEFRIAVQIERQPVKTNRSLVFSQIDAKKGKLNLEPEPQNYDFHQKRVDILKAQLLKQQRYIKRLTTILQTTRHFYEDLKEYLKYFSHVLRSSSTSELYPVVPTSQPVIEVKVESSLGRRKSQPKTKQTEGEADDSFDRQQSLSGANRVTKTSEQLDLAEKKQHYISLKTMLAQFKSNEERETFIQTFSQAYTKIIEYEKMNSDFKSLFEVQRRINAPNKLIYKHPIRSLVKQYGGYFPIKTIYTAFPMKDRERLEHMIYTLEGISGQIQRDLAKVDTFWLFKSNPFFFQSKENRTLIELPINMLEEAQVYDQFLQEPEKHRVINLDGRMLSDVEADLVRLMDQLFEMQKRSSEVKDLKHLTSVGGLQEQLRKSLESLVCLSSMIGNSNKKTINKIYIVSNKEAYLYQQQILSQSDFDQKYQQIELLLDDLAAVVNTSELTIVKKALLILKSIKNTQEVQKMITIIRENEISLLRQKINLILQDYQGVNDFVTAAEKQMKSFYGSINSKFQTALNQFNLIIEQDKLADLGIRKQFGQSFKKTLKEIQDYIQQQSDLMRSENMINILQLQQEFDKKVSTFFVRSETLLRQNDQISKA